MHNGNLTFTQCDKLLAVNHSNNGKGVVLSSIFFLAHNLDQVFQPEVFQPEVFQPEVFQPEVFQPQQAISLFCPWQGTEIELFLLNIFRWHDKSSVIRHQVGKGIKPVKFSALFGALSLHPRSDRPIGEM